MWQTMETANSYMFRPLTGHHQVVHLMKMFESDGSYIVYCLLYIVQSSALFIRCAT